MTVLRGGWGVLLPRRQQGLSKMMAYSVFFHFCLFLFIILNRTFSSRMNSFDGFQVNLVAPGAGLGLTSLGRTKSRVKRPLAAKKSSSKQAVPKTIPVKTSVKSTQSEPKGSSLLTRAPRRSVNAPPPEKDDPERLQEWWKKQKKALRTPSVTPGIKPKMGISERTRTAKIDIQKRPNLVPPVASPPKPGSKPTPSPGEGISKEQGSLETEPSQKTADSSLSEGSLFEGLQTEGDASVQASLAPGIIAGVSLSGGGSSFLFPNYLQKVDHKIRWRWAPPPVASTGDRLVIRFVIQKNGGIDKSSIGIEESSGNLFFDQAAIRAIYAAHPLPPLPRAYGEDVLIVFMNFIVKEDS